MHKVPSHPKQIKRLSRTPKPVAAHPGLITCTRRGGGARQTAAARAGESSPRQPRGARDALETRVESDLSPHL